MTTPPTMKKLNFGDVIIHTPTSRLMILLGRTSPFGDRDLPDQTYRAISWIKYGTVDDDDRPYNEADVELIRRDSFLSIRGVSKNINDD
jgi:hypothetical protein